MCDQKVCLIVGPIGYSDGKVTEMSEHTIDDGLAYDHLMALPLYYKTPRENGGIQWWSWFEGDQFINLIYRAGKWFLRNEDRGA